MSAGSNKISALILDMDGVIVDTEPIHVDSFRVFLKKRAIVAPEDFLLGLIGHSVEENVKEIRRTYFSGQYSDMGNDVREREDIYLDLLKASAIKPQPGLEKLVKYCLKAGIKLALASSSIREQISVILDKLHVQSGNTLNYHAVFSEIVSGEDVIRKKPAPDIYTLALSKMGVKHSQGLAVEDSPAGIQAAQAAGLKCIAIRTDYVAAERLAIADNIINTLDEVPEILQNYNMLNIGA